MKVFEELLPASEIKKLAIFIALLLLSSLSNSVYSQSLNSQRVDETISSHGQLEQTDERIEVAFPILLPDQILEIGAGFEFEYGPYDLRSALQLDERGQLLQEAGDHLNASLHFKQALHISRVNAGLYHESQIELLDSLIDCDIALRNWEAVNNHYAYMELLYRRLYSIEDVRLESGLQKVVAWHISAMNVNLNGKRFEHLLQANKLFKLRLRVAELTLMADDPKLDFLYGRVAASERQLYLSSSLNREIQRRHRQRTNGRDYYRSNRRR